MYSTKINLRRIPELLLRSRRRSQRSLCIASDSKWRTRALDFLLARIRFKFNHVVIVNDVPNLYRPATNFAVFDVGLAPYGSVQNHRNLFTAIGTFEIVFHTLTCVLT